MNETNINKLVCVSADCLVKEDHEIRKVAKIVNKLKINDKLKHLYTEGVGRKGYEPELLVRIALVQVLFKTGSMRATCKLLEDNFAARWFIGLGIFDKVPSHATVSNAFVNRFDKNFFKNLFTELLIILHDNGVLSVNELFVDSTAVKASSNKRKIKKEHVLVTIKDYLPEIDQLKETDEVLHERLKDKIGKEPKSKEEYVEKVVPVTDSDAGIFKKEGHPEMPAYKAHAISDENGFLTGLDVTAGNVHDSQGFFGVFNSLPNKIIEEATALAGDSAYATPEISKTLDDNGIELNSVFPKRGKQVEYTKDDFKYDEEKDVYICPNKKTLKLGTVDRKSGRYTYNSKSKDCKECPFKAKCTSGKIKQLSFHIHDKYVDKAKKIVGTESHTRIYGKRKHTIEPIFGTGKTCYNLGETKLRGLIRVKDSIFKFGFVWNILKFIKYA